MPMLRGINRDKAWTVADTPAFGGSTTRHRSAEGLSESSQQAHRAENSSLLADYRSEIKRPPFDVGLLPQVVNTTETLGDPSKQLPTDTEIREEKHPEDKGDTENDADTVTEEDDWAKPTNETKSGDQYAPDTSTSVAAEVEGVGSSGTSNGTMPVDPAIPLDIRPANDTYAISEAVAANVTSVPTTPSSSGSSTMATMESTSMSDQTEKNESSTPSPAEAVAANVTSVPTTPSSSGSSTMAAMESASMSAQTEKNESSTPNPTPSPRRPLPASSSTPRSKGTKWQSGSTNAADEKKTKPEIENPSRAKDVLQKPTVKPKPSNEELDSASSIPLSGGTIASRGVNCSLSNGFVARLSCTTAATIHDHPIVFSVVSLVVLLVLCRMCRSACCRTKRDERGEYRSVAAQYGELLYDNTFDDNYSFADANSTGSMMSDDEEDDWSQGVKIEMSGIREERNGGLSLEEMNG